MSRAAELLDLATGYIEHGWCKSHLCATADGHRCTQDDPRAVKWSLLGAIDRAEESLIVRYGITAAWDARAIAVRRVQEECAAVNLSEWNDAKERTVQQVLKVLIDARKGL